MEVSHGVENQQRSYDEVLRLLDSCQLTAKHKVATPVNWKPGEDVIIVPAVSDADAKQVPRWLEGAEAVHSDRCSPEVAPERTAATRPAPPPSACPSPESRLAPAPAIAALATDGIRRDNQIMSAATERGGGKRGTVRRVAR